MLCHLAMAIIMLVYVRSPAISPMKSKEAASDWWNGVDEEEIEARDRVGEEIEVYPGADLWYVYTVAIHITQGILSFLDLFVSGLKEVRTYSTLMESLSLLLVIAHMYNFILMMIYYCHADPFEQQSSEN